jgi:exosortase C (VPDSG-CTERM-specific)
MPDKSEVITFNHRKQAGWNRSRMTLIPRSFLLATGALIVGFALPIYHWAGFAVESDLFSYVLLVPAVSFYLAFVDSKRPRSTELTPHRSLVLVPIIGGIASLGTYWFARLSGVELAEQDAMALTMFSFVCFFAATCMMFLNGAFVRNIAFGLAFLLFMAPFPTAVEETLEALLQHGSAPPAYWLFTLAGTPVYKEGMVFQLPGIALQIAPECSGIRSTLVLFMTSLIAGKLFLRSRWRRTALAAFVLPLALVRNGFRVFVIGELCVHVGPHMIDSPIHHQGGPIFFALSLVPFSLFLWWLIRSERKAKNDRPAAETSAVVSEAKV